MRQSRFFRGVMGVTLMTLLILDTKTAVIGAQDGITICLRSVIPSLFPFVVLSGLLAGTAMGSTPGFLRPLGKLCGIPKGTESIVLLGCISGYPVGAQLVGNAYRGGRITKADGHRMLAFCSNAGPAFIFGICGSLFPNPLVPWVLWGTHLFSAVMVGAILPNKSRESVENAGLKTPSFPELLERSIKTMATVCGWVIIFRILIGYLNKWVLWSLPNELQVFLSGALELANGCLQLNRIECDGLAFVIAGLMLSLGGLCVLMQTASVTKELGLGLYFPGKVMQAAFSFTLNCHFQPLLFSADDRFNAPIALNILLLLMSVGIVKIIRKKVVAFT